MTTEQKFRYELTKLALEHGVHWQLIPIVVPYLQAWILDGRDTLPRHTPDTAQTNTPDPVL